MKGQSATPLYFLLILWAGISLGDYIAGATALREEFFHSGRYSRQGFELSDNDLKVESLRPEAKNAGLAVGDSIQTINGEVFTGAAQVQRMVRSRKPGSFLALQVHHSDGTVKEVRIRLAPRAAPDFTTPGLAAFLLPILGVPVICLALGYWVVAARPRDFNAWLVLFLLSSTQALFGNLDYSFWGGASLVVFGLFNAFVQVFLVFALFWFGIYFPERWRADRRWPWVKWLLLAIYCCIFVVEVWGLYAMEFDAAQLPRLSAIGRLTDVTANWLNAICIVVFLIALMDKWRTVSIADARRRLRVLAIGSALSLGPILIIFVVTPLFGIDAHHGNWYIALIPLIVLFPFTLAYVVVVQRAMELRILLRMGTKYLLAKATIILLQAAIVLFVLLRFVMPLMQGSKHPVWEWIISLSVVGILVRFVLMRDSLWARLQRQVDRKFFREAYNSEVVLTELSEQTRHYTEKGPLIETVSRRISEILHVSDIAVWLRGGGVFLLQQDAGLGIGPVILTENSVMVQALTRSNRPATVYRDRPEEWFEQAGEGERDALRRVNAELLLPLPGRDRLMGVMSLGPKRSEEPYTPTDLRVLQSVATQTGLALEVSDLAESLANEAAQRARADREIEIAREVQQRLFPQKMPDIAGITLAGLCRPALGVGGDYYDLIDLPDGRLGIAIGDVSGKGISAALLMASLRASLRALTMEAGGDLAGMMRKVNLLVYESSAVNRYATFFFAALDPGTNELRYVNAGHNPPMLIHGSTGRVTRLEAGGLVVGLLPFATYEEQRIVLEAGDLLLTYTDGISEAMTVSEEEWGEERMLAAAERVVGRPADAILHSLFQAADEFTAGAPQHDDMTLLIVALRGNNL